MINLRSFNKEEMRTLLTEPLAIIIHRQVCIVAGRTIKEYTVHLLFTVNQNAYFIFCFLSGNIESERYGVGARRLNKLFVYYMRHELAKCK